MKKGDLKSIFSVAKIGLAGFLTITGVIAGGLSGYAIVDGMANTESSGLYAGLSYMFAGAAGVYAAGALYGAKKLIQSHLRL